MKKFLLLFLVIGVTSCSVDELDMDNSSIGGIDAVAESVGCAGADNSRTVTPQFVDENLYTAARIKRFYLDLLNEDVSKIGTFKPTISELASNYLENPLGDFTTTYTVSTNDCQDSVVLTLTVAYSVEDACETDAGDDQTRIMAPQYVEENLYTAARVKRYFLNMLDNGVSEEGKFNPTITDIITDFMNNGLGSYTTTYTVGEGSCLDSTELTLIIEEPCDVNAGSDITITITSQFVEEQLNTAAKIERFFLELIDDGISQDGDFSPSIHDIKEQYILNGPGTFTTNYTVGEEGCQDSAELTLIIEDKCTADAGTNKYVTVTRDYVQKNLYTAARIKRFYLNLLDSGINKEGTFDPTISQIASSYLENPIGEFTTTYTIDLENCQDSVELTINVIE